MKGSLDQGLKIQALKNGVNIHFKKKLPENQVDIVATGPIITGKIPAIGKGIIFKTKMKDISVALFNDKAAFKTYSYLSIIDGDGCICTIQVEDMNDVDLCFKETKRIFSEIVELDIQKPKCFGGIAYISNKNIFKKNKSLFVGEAAGLQDFLWGFGMRYAITSGFLAAKSIIDGKDYEKIAERYFRPKLKAGIVNRFLLEKFAGKNNYSYFINIIENLKDPIKSSYYMYNYNFIHKLIYPFAMNYMKKVYPYLK